MTTVSVSPEPSSEVGVDLRLTLSSPTIDPEDPVASQFPGCTCVNITDLVDEDKDKLAKYVISSSQIVKDHRYLSHLKSRLNRVINSIMDMQIDVIDYMPRSGAGSYPRTTVIRTRVNNVYYDILDGIIPLEKGLENVDKLLEDTYTHQVIDSFPALGIHVNKSGVYNLSDKPYSTLVMYASSIIGTSNIAALILALHSDVYADILEVIKKSYKAVDKLKRSYSEKDIRKLCALVFKLRTSMCGMSDRGFNRSSTSGMPLDQEHNPIISEEFYQSWKKVIELVGEILDTVCYSHVDGCTLPKELPKADMEVLSRDYTWSKKEVLDVLDHLTGHEHYLSLQDKSDGKNAIRNVYIVATPSKKFWVTPVDSVKLECTAVALVVETSPITLECPEDKVEVALGPFVLASYLSPLVSPGTSPMKMFTASALMPKFTGSEVFHPHVTGLKAGSSGLSPGSGTLCLGQGLDLIYGMLRFKDVVGAIDTAVHMLNTYTKKDAYSHLTSWVPRGSASPSTRRMTFNLGSGDQGAQYHLLVDLTPESTGDNAPAGPTPLREFSLVEEPYYDEDYEECYCCGASIDPNDPEYATVSDVSNAYICSDCSAPDRYDLDIKCSWEECVPDLWNDWSIPRIKFRPYVPEGDPSRDDYAQLWVESVDGSPVVLVGPYASECRIYESGFFEEPSTRRDSVCRDSVVIPLDRYWVVTAKSQESFVRSDMLITDPRLRYGKIGGGSSGEDVFYFVNNTNDRTSDRIDGRDDVFHPYEGCDRAVAWVGINSLPKEDVYVQETDEDSTHYRLPSSPAGVVDIGEIPRRPIRWVDPTILRDRFEKYKSLIVPVPAEELTTS